jgi:hypothetical protein
MNWKSIVTILGIVIVFSVGVVYFNKYKNLEKEIKKKVELEIAIQNIQKRDSLLIEEKNILKKELEKNLILISQQEKDYEKLNKKYEKSRIVIDKLNNSESFYLFTRNAEKYKNK